MKRVYRVGDQAYMDWFSATKTAGGKKVEPIDVFEENEFPHVGAAKAALGAEDVTTSAVEVTSTKRDGSGSVITKREEVVLLFTRKVGDFDATAEGRVVGKGKSSFIRLKNGMLKIGG